ncbi:hypothetical protein B0A50_07971 [Salinomyces thailandicus]|uniref:Uncharacterized protein n=1 Tax=Salinomyces thailandicus TaxID=706561 RepID=A0A4U0TLI2_9PEZI|nr:hypothetical protein B0A50_07971 [Salinomyces thailandica]
MIALLGAQGKRGDFKDMWEMDQLRVPSSILPPPSSCYHHHRQQQQQQQQQQYMRDSVSKAPPQPSNQTKPSPQRPFASPKPPPPFPTSASPTSVP